MHVEVEEIRPLRIELVQESPTNPRQTFTGMEELVASVRQTGIVVPLLVRPTGDTFEVCYGHRRLRAAREVGLETVPGIVRELTDEQFLEAQLLENIQRADLSELEEADAYAALLKTGYTGERIAEMTGKTKSYVYSRAKLAALGKEGRAALATGEHLDPSTALLLARMPPKLQRRAVLDLAGESYLTTFRQRRDYLYESVFRRLEQARWALDDATLEPKAGACSSCTKSSLGDPDLKGAGADVCTDLECWDRKSAALYQLKVGASGRRALSKSDLAAAFPAEWQSTPDPTKWLVPGYTVSNGKKGPRTLEDLAAEQGVELEIAVGLRAGDVVELVPRKAADALIAAAGLKTAPAVDWNERYKKQDATRRKKQEAQDAKLQQLHAAVLATGAVPRWVLEELVDHRSYAIPRKLRWKGRIEKVPLEQLCALVVVAHVAYRASSAPKLVDESLKRIGAAAAAVAPPKAPAKAKAKGRPPPAKAKAKGRPPVKAKAKAKARKRK